MADNWVADLEQQIKGAFEQQKEIPQQVIPAPLPVIPKTAPKDDKTNFMFIFIIIMFVGVFMAWKAKANNPSMTWSNINPISPATNSVEQRLELFKKQYNNLDEATNKIWERTKWNSDHVTLLGILNNHNIVVLQQNHPKTELILLNKDWTINRLPDRVQLDAQDKEFLNKFLKKN